MPPARSRWLPVLPETAGLIELKLDSPLTLLMFLALVIAVSIPVFYLFERPLQTALRRVMQSPP